MAKNTTITIGQSILQMPYRKKNPMAAKHKHNGEWIETSWLEYYNNIIAMASYIRSLNLNSFDRIAIMSNTRIEWTVTDLAIFASQNVSVPIYANNTPEDIQYILNDSESQILFIGGNSELKMWHKIKDQCPHVKHVISFDSIKTVAEITSWKSCLQNGKLLSRTHNKDIVSVLQNMKQEDMATLLYTSGTTGKPKGVVLTHEQVISEVSEAFPLCGADEFDTSLCFLPLAHVLGRIEHWGHVYIGHTLAFAESIDKVKENLIEIRPTFLMSVPRIFEKIHSTILTQVGNSKAKQKLFNWAIDVGYKISDLKLSRQTIPLPLLLEYEMARKLVLLKVKNAFGGRLRFAISGGAPLAREIAQFFHASDILILEGYGLTETTAAIAVNTPFNFRFGSVGRPIGETQVKIAEDGEILIKSSKVMKEYYKNPDATREAFSDGWFHTGDIGHLLPGGDLKITDRKKDLIKTAGGKYVAPQRLEGLLKLDPLVAHALIHGDQKKYVIALITLDRINLEKWAHENKIAYSNWTELCSNSKVEEHIRNVVSTTNKELASFESIKKFKILPVEFTIEGGELTPSLKVKRKIIDARYIKEIESLYD